MNPWVSQLFGISLACSTAFGCLAYERLVKNYSICVVAGISGLSYLLFFLCGWLFQNTQPVTELIEAHKKHTWSCLIYWVTWITTPLWYVITRNQTVMAGALYEFKYIVVLALFYIVFGENKFTLNTAIGTCLALGSVYFISRK